jgi:UrcA family protein
MDARWLIGADVRDEYGVSGDESVRAHTAQSSVTRGARALIEPYWYGHGDWRDEYVAGPQTTPPLWESHMRIVKGDEVSDERTHQTQGELNMYSTKTLIAVAAGLALGITGIGTSFASTSDNDAGPRVVVRYAEAELATPEGVQHVRQRILSAVGQVCPAADMRDVERWVRAEACRSQAIARAVAQVKNPRLAAVLALSTHQS